VFTAAQAQAGQAAYENTCGQCHTPTLLGRKGEPGELPPLTSLSPGWQKFIATSRGIVPPLAGKTFRDRWGEKSIAQFILRLQEAVPAFPPEGMNDQTTVNIAAYVLRQNGARAGAEPLTRNTRGILNSVLP
jgi:mono/diheme cytochrome c family protein